MSSQRPTISQLARELGLGVATVSNALNEKGRVSVATRERVLEHAQRRGYQPNAAARNLRTGAAGAIELHLPQQARHLSFYTDFAFGVVDAAAAVGRDVLLTTAERARDNGAIGVDGAVFIDCDAGSARLAELVEAGIPVVAGEGVGAGDPEPALSINVDYAAVMNEVLRAAVDAGTRSPMLVAPDTSLDSSWRDRLEEAFVASCTELGVAGRIVEFPVNAPDPQLIKLLSPVVDNDGHFDACGTWSVENGVVGQPYSPPPAQRPDALIFGGQRLAAVACAAFDLGLPGTRVPLVASLAADQFSEVGSRRIAGLDVKPRDYGAECGQKLLELLDSDTARFTPEVQGWETRMTWPGHWVGPVEQ